MLAVPSDGHHGPIRPSTYATRGAAREARIRAAAELVHEDLVRRGASRGEVTVSQREMASATGLTIEEVGLGSCRLQHERRVVRDRPADTMVAYTYRVLR